MSTAALAAAWKRHVAGTTPAPRVVAPATAGATWHNFVPSSDPDCCLCGEAHDHQVHRPAPTGFTYTLHRAGDGQRLPCVLLGDHTQPCNAEGGTYIAARSDGREQRLCACHASRLAASKGLPFPVMAP